MQQLSVQQKLINPVAHLIQPFERPLQMVIYWFWKLLPREMSLIIANVKLLHKRLQSDWIFNSWQYCRGISCFRSVIPINRLLVLKKTTKAMTNSNHLETFETIGTLLKPCPAGVSKFVVTIKIPVAIKAKIWQSWSAPTVNQPSKNLSATKFTQLKSAKKILWICQGWPIWKPKLDIVGNSGNFCHSQKYQGDPIGPSWKKQPNLFLYTWWCW